MRINKLFIFSFLLLLLTSCYSDYVHVNYDIHNHSGSKPRWNDNRTQVVFLASIGAYRRAEGITAFPDGGQSKYLYKDVSIYTLNVATNTITRVISMNDLIELLGAGKNRWRLKIFLRNNSVYYCVLCSEDNNLWGRYDNKIKSHKLDAIKRKYSKAFRVDIKSTKQNAIDLSTFFSLYGKKDNNDIERSEFNKLISKTSLKERGLLIEKISPMSRLEYVNHIVAKKGGKTTRKAILEQIIPKMNNDEIDTMFKRMEGHKETLGYDKDFYDTYLQELKSKIKKR